MERFAFISRHPLTEKQSQLAEKSGIEIVAVGDRDAFNFDTTEFAGEFHGIICVHPAIAMDALQDGFKVGVFENANRAPAGEKPQFEAKDLHIWFPNA